MAFKIGDRVVHPHHGIGTITNLSQREFGAGESRAYYEIAIGDGTLWVPVDEPELGLRKLTAKSQLEKCGKVLEAVPSSLDVASRELRGQLSKHLRDGSILAQCEVVRDLTALSWRKPLVGPMAEFRRMAFSVLCQEWAAVAEVPLTEATQTISNHLGRCKELHQA